MTTQIRIYQIKPGKMKEWVEGWTRGVYPLRRKHGFHIPGAWVIGETNTFVWILSYEGPEGFEAKNRAYYASEDRRTLQPDPAEHIAKTDEWFVTPIV